VENIADGVIVDFCDSDSRGAADGPEGSRWGRTVCGGAPSTALGYCGKYHFPASHQKSLSRGLKECARALSPLSPGVIEGIFMDANLLPLLCQMLTEAETARNGWCRKDGEYQGLIPESGSMVLFGITVRYRVTQGRSTHRFGPDHFTTSFA
jgi:hypothetical protein